MKRLLPLLSVFVAANAFGQANPSIYETILLDTKSNFPVANRTGQAQPNPINVSAPTLFGIQNVTVPAAGGNSVSESAFRAAVNQAHAQGTGGVLDLDNATYSNLLMPSDPSQTSEGDYAKSLTVNYGPGRSLEIGQGPNNYREVNTPDYRGFATGLTSPVFGFSDFQNPNPPETINEGSFLITPAGQIGGITSFDFLFDPADRIVMYGFNVFMRNNFQNYRDPSQSTPFDDVANVRVSAFFSDGSEQASVALSQQADETIFFGFEAPEDAFLERVTFFTVARTARVFNRIDDAGFVTAPAPIPEPATLWLLGTGAIALIATARARRK